MTRKLEFKHYIIAVSMALTLWLVITFMHYFAGDNYVVSKTTTQSTTTTWGNDTTAWKGWGK